MTSDQKPTTTAAFARQDVSFPSADGTCSAWLYRPAKPAASTPVIVMAHGFGGVKENRLDAYAERFSAEGYACLVFDYRHFGTSSGEPRELVDIRRQLADWRHAVAYARTLDGIDPASVVLWGTSFAGGHVLDTASRDDRIAAVISQCPFTDGLAAGLAMPKLTATRLMLKATADVVSAKRKRPAVRVPIVGRPGDLAVMTSPDAKIGFDLLVAESAIKIPEALVPARVMFQVPTYRPGRRLAAIAAPSLICICENDSVAPARRTAKLVDSAPRASKKLYPAGHFDIYVGDQFESVVRDQIAFLEKVVPVHPSTTTSQRG